MYWTLWSEIRRLRTRHSVRSGCRCLASRRLLLRSAWSRYGDPASLRHLARDGNGWIVSHYVDGSGGTTCVVERSSILMIRPPLFIDKAVPPPTTSMVAVASLPLMTGVVGSVVPLIVTSPVVGTAPTASLRR